MCYPRDAFAVNYDEEPVCHYSGIGIAHPCWSLDALLDLIPHTGVDGIEINNNNDGKTIWTAIFRWKTDITQIRIADTPLDAIYQIVIWLLENNYINKTNNGKDR